MGKKSRKPGKGRGGATSTPQPRRNNNTASSSSKASNSSRSTTASEALKNLAPLAVDLSTIDTSKCAYCHKPLSPTTWREKEFILLTCCGSHICLDCEESSNNESKQASDKYNEDRLKKTAKEQTASSSASGESEKNDETNKIPELVCVYKKVCQPCPTCNSPPPRTQEERLAQLQRLANAGMAEGQYILACHLFKGKHGAKQSIAEAVELYRKAAVQGHSNAQAAIVDRYMKGDGVEPQNYRKAKEWCEQCDDECAIAQDALGHIYQYGHGGVPIDNDKALEAFRKSAAEGFPPGMDDYGVSLSQLGREDEALELFVKCGSDETWLRGYQSPIAACQANAALIYHKKKQVALSYFWASRAKKNGNELGKRLFDVMKPVITRQCALCGKESGLSKCVSCKSIYYCGPTCQRLAWIEHKKECRAIPEIITKPNVYDKDECSYCYKRDPVLMCDRCHGTYYCDNDAKCQLMHWPVHRTECVKACSTSKKEKKESTAS